MLLLARALGIPINPTHTITGAIMRVGLSIICPLICPLSVGIIEQLLRLLSHHSR
jgi:phosphate/sulfate permease